MKKAAESNYPLHELIRERWSPRAFGDRSLTKEEIGTLIEAARWAPSCFNEQPWRFLFFPADHSETREKAHTCLVEGNAWAKAAPLLVLTVCKNAFSARDKENRHAQHDLGLAVENMVLQAQSMGISSHQMAGIHADKAKEVFAIPDGFTVMTMIAFGMRGNPDLLEDSLKERETAKRERKSAKEIAFDGEWEKGFDV